MGKTKFIQIAGLLAASMLMIACGLEDFFPISELTSGTPPAPGLATFPAGSTVPAGFATAGPPVPLGEEGRAGSLSIWIDNVIRPASQISGGYNTLEAGEQYLLVDITILCHDDSPQPCRVTEMDFRVNTSSGQSYAPEFSSFLSGVDQPFEGGELQPGVVSGGDLVFIIHDDDVGLVLAYPAFLPMPGYSASLSLGE